uniref:Uncharacterized protein n=1 Tax=Arundo donax TaxID=35708 RepID=A0A0A8YNA6_ARUDO
MCYHDAMEYKVNSASDYCIPILY